MVNAITDAGKDGEDNVDSLHILDKDIELTEDAIVLQGLTSNVKSEHLMQLNRIPRQIISFDEQYLRCCLELIKISALRETSCNVPLGVSNFFGQLSSRKISSGDACDWNRNVFECPGVAGANNFGVSSAGDSVLGAITRSRSMRNILKSPLLCQMGTSDNSVNFGGTSLVGIGETVHPYSVASTAGSDASLLEKVQKEALVLRDHINGYEPAHNRLSSLSSTNSSCSDQSSSAFVSQGMLHRTWNNALPHYVFSIDDQREIYVANLLKVGSPDNKVLDFMYIFHRRSVGQKGDVVHDKESDLVGRMKVTTSSTLLSDNTEVKETHFVLFGVDDDCSEEMRTPSHARKRSLFAKNFFKASHTHKIKNSPKLGVSSSIPVNSSLNPCQSSTSNLKPTSRISLSKDPFPPNLELAAIVLKTQITYHNNNTDLGGWGLKFLNKRGNAQTDASVVEEVPSRQNYQQENGDCSTSVDILIPAGFHGGPRTRNGGPSSLTGRWKSGGRCDCGGWDEGCPLTKLNARSSRTDDLLQTDLHWKSKTSDILVEGSKQDVPTMKMVGIHDNLYCISFQSTLSAVQSFSIATAIIHAHSPTIQTKPIQGGMTGIKD